MINKDQEFLEYVVKAIVSEPSKVEIDRKVDGMGVLLTLKVAPIDVSKIIGKKGQIAKAIRLLLKTVGYASRVRANLKIDAPRIQKEEEQKENE